jgi:hypothetical protein
VLSNPFASQLAWDCENTSLHLLHKWPCISLYMQMKNQNIELRLARQAGRCFEKVSASPLASVSYKKTQAFAQRINSRFLGFLSETIFPIRG